LARIAQIKAQAELEKEYMEKREELRILKNVNELVKNWIFSLIAESEKMKKYAHLKGLKTI